MKREFQQVSDMERLAIRQSYIDDIRSIVPGDEQEQIEILATIRLIESGIPIHKPANIQQHLGVIFMLLTPDRQKTLLINHRKAQQWLPPGGHVAEFQTFQDCVTQEMREELSQEVSFISREPFFLSHTITTGTNAGHTDITSWFLVEGNEQVQYIIEEKEASQYIWTPLETLLQMPEYGNLPRAYRKIKSLIS